ncbi:ATP-dependent helicase, DEAD/DEAH box family [Myxococcus xanthus DK 1622]|uniref:ATP-dependent helicase, DEAD/DEAH box family n=1 Tax=Myxococcus xanthus (strain DK1622) TaxID=246197 RepID=Q1D3X9_MYXXD|nr:MULTISPECIES: DEAD/DEAH box helicase [Myxococcus]ABF88218.1 ATP-dependent helicase, DEAD/DEAH box family [Myxococcus xanthus DK 1622]NOJ57504.1 DEAD/DEAH box helicase [Myxococcus xanthus]QPM77054.1 DEAD/DEAH box helicase [Myxococcus xanthus]QVW66122.1 DEAD/DEAH box helicase [Myxococcus xanthus DZ2]QZZ52158.1 hypothetical protein MyxoNM_23390 [Myxococcus xanthus]
MTTPETLRIARIARVQLATPALTESQAKLYSQSARLQMGRLGLSKFTSNDISASLDEALLLIQAALIEKKADKSERWRSGMKRAGEILEWLSQRDLRRAGQPLHFLSAAAYQLAGYPALAHGHIRQIPTGDPTSEILREYLRANFPGTIKAIKSYWAGCSRQETGTDGTDGHLSDLAIQHTVMCIGLICEHLRTGREERVARALDKLDKLASGFLHSNDPYSWILARLTAEISHKYIETSLWTQIDNISTNSHELAASALSQFARASFTNCRALVWPSQAKGIENLRTDDSFILCTPTGSGKTTIATLAAIKSLFTAPATAPSDDQRQSGNLVLYLVPSRALAAEVESRLEQDLRSVAQDPVIVTGLYGGIDWGPTDAWIDSDRPTVLICTFEKADALLRYLGILFLHRVRLVVIDEAHMVDFERSNASSLEDGTSRSFRLELLGTRLLRAQDAYNFRIVALSAVAANAAPALARWVTTNRDSVPTRSDYRSTRQMLGRLEVSPTGVFRITYELMDGRSLRFKNGRTYEKPFIPAPFPPLPNEVQDSLGPEKRLRGPTLWAALHLAARRSDDTRPTVLISLTQHITPFAEDCLEHLDSWNTHLPDYFPTPPATDTWANCLASVADYFSADSIEYKLLVRGIAVHHGKLPPLVSRRLKQVIDSGLVKIIIATSTLSEGVNISVNYLLLPSVFRANDAFTVQEFSNLIGRAGRPGVSTEGHALAVQMADNEKANRQRQGFDTLVHELKEVTDNAALNEQEDASSPLFNLILAIWDAWSDISPDGTQDEFEEWLEMTATQSSENAATIRLDALDNFILSTIEEVEQIKNGELSDTELEDELARIWQKTYAHACTTEEDRLRSAWLTRGLSLKKFYPSTDIRRRIYKSSLPPRSALALIEKTEDLRSALLDGSDYAIWPSNLRFEFVAKIVNLVSEVPSFYISKKFGSKRSEFTDWQKVLQWWLAKDTLSKQPSPKELPNWFDYASRNFLYRSNWGIGSSLGLLLDAGDGSMPIRPLEISDWPRSGLPWIAFWLKELLSWGTLEPVAAYLLARGNAVDRKQAEASASEYYSAVAEMNLTPNELLDPRRIRNWIQAHAPKPSKPLKKSHFEINVRLTHDPSHYNQGRMSVQPIETEDGLNWIEPAGYIVAVSDKPENWPSQTQHLDFELLTVERQVFGSPYLAHSTAQESQ